MGAIAATKGYYIQVLVTVLGSLDDNDWESFLVDPKDDEKVDIKWYYPENKKIVVTQIKHSKDKGFEHDEGRNLRGKNVVE